MGCPTSGMSLLSSPQAMLKNDSKEHRYQLTGPVRAYVGEREKRRLRREQVSRRNGEFQTITNVIGLDAKETEH